MSNSSGPSALDELARAVRRDLELLEYPRRPWLEPRRSVSGEPIYDVVIVGGGQSGLTAAFGLLRERVTNLLVLDQNPLDHADPWLNFARMRTLRTPKYQTGPDLGIEADFGHFEVDFVIATGFVTDLAARPELAQFEPLIAPPTHWDSLCRYAEPEF